MRFGWPEALIILVVVLVVFGAGKLSSVGGALGKSLREFRKAKDGAYDDEDEKTKKKDATAKEITGDSTKTKQS